MPPYRLSLLLLLILLPAALSQSPQYSSPPPPPPLRGFDTYTGIIIAAVIIIFFALAFFFLYTGCFITTSTPIDSSFPSPPPAKLGLDPDVLASFPTLLYSDVKHHRTAPLDCAVCLCEFEEKETLRLLPKCNHAFHPDCIGMWLHSHVTCPVCRANLKENGKVDQEGEGEDVVVEVWGEGERERFTLRVPERRLRRWATMEAPKAVSENEKGLGAVGRGVRSERWTAARRTWSLGGEEETPVEIVCMA